MPGSTAESRALTLAIALALGASATLAGAQESAKTPRPPTSVRGTLVSVNHVTNTLIMKSNEGDNLGWRFEKDIIAEAEGFEAGALVIVIYRDLPEGVKRVTALAFPGAEKEPTYVNLTGERVVLRSAPPVGGGCDQHLGGSSSATESTIPPGGRAVALEACWCCAVAGQSCAPTTKTGVGRAYLAQCFE